MIRLLRHAKVEDEQLRTLYQAAMPDQEPQRLRWVEGILEAFQNADWGQQAYDELMAEITDAGLQARLAASRESRLGRELIR